MARFIINGPTHIDGRFVPKGNKNAALPMLAASLLTEESVSLSNIPEIEDVEVMLEILAELGVEIERSADKVTLRARDLRSTAPRPDLCRRIRGSIVLAGPLAVRLGKASIHNPGGDAIGRRRVDTHFEGLQALSLDVEADPDNAVYRLGCAHAAPADLILDEASVTATENVIMAASLIPGRSTIYNAACEPHVQCLCRLLNKMGASIEGIGTNRLRIEGVESLHGADYRISPDYVETGSLLAATAATGGAITIPVEDDPVTIDIICRPFRKLGVGIVAEGGELRLGPGSDLTVRNELDKSIPKIEDGVWPAFPSDLMSVVLVLATQAKGTVIFFEKLFESRMYFVDRLIEMGARIVQCDPHRVVVNGPSQLYGTHQTSPDIRAGMALLIAAFCAKGQSVIENAQMIDRGYAQIDQRLRDLGVDIERDETSQPNTQ